MLNYYSILNLIHVRQFFPIFLQTNLKALQYITLAQCEDKVKENIFLRYVYVTNKIGLALPPSAILTNLFSFCFVPYIYISMVYGKVFIVVFKSSLPVTLNPA
jgi:hypothetical protein